MGKEEETGALRTEKSRICCLCSSAIPDNFLPEARGDDSRLAVGPGWREVPRGTSDRIQLSGRWGNKSF